MYIPLADLKHNKSTVYVQAAESSRPELAICTRRSKGGLLSGKSSSTFCRAVWERDGVLVELEEHETGIQVWVSAPKQAVSRIYLRLGRGFSRATRILGDAWERSYGELEWRGIVPNRPLPWYFLATSKKGNAAYGVRTGAASLAHWLVDHQGFTLVLDLRCGGLGVELGERRLLAATVVQYWRAYTDETPFQSLREFCAMLCPQHITPAEPVVGHNDWYWLYGKNSEALILEATERLMELYPTDAAVRPWSVIDDGWQPHDHAETGFRSNGGPWDRSVAAFPDMAGLAAKIKEFGARPGIWMRPLLTKADVPKAWTQDCPKLPGEREREGHALDPSLPEVLELVREDIRRLRGWGYEMIKHDFSTYDVTGRWGLEMNAASTMAPAGWAFADRSRTTAEILTGLYEAIREAAGPETMIIGCNVIGHLAAGLVEVQRIGDDTSARDWDRTRRMGVNTLAFRAAQQGRFFAADADCVPISPHIPAPLTEAWLDLVARSGTPLFLSIDPAACDDRAKAALREALAIAVQPREVAEPLDWLDTAVPTEWRFNGAKDEEPKVYKWSEWS